MEWRAGDVTGVLPYSRLVSPPGDTVAQESTEILAVPRDDLDAMIRDCHRGHVDPRAQDAGSRRVFTSSGLHDEKMVSLGKLSAGLAHELNNPASAIERSAALLEDRLEDAERAARALGASRLTDSQLAAIDAVRERPASPRARTACCLRFRQAEREDAIADWLADHGLDAAIAGPLAETAVTLDALDRIAERGWRTAARRGASIGGSRMFGSRDRLGDSGSGDADLRPGHGHQGLHAHGSGHGGRACGPDVEPRQHGRRAQIKGAGEIDCRRGERGTRPSACPRLRRRAQPDLGESDRQRPRCRA